jgi:hypothetical protein
VLLCPQDWAILGQPATLEVTPGPIPLESAQQQQQHPKDTATGISITSAEAAQCPPARCQAGDVAYSACICWS